MTNIKQYEEKIIDVNDSLNRLKQNDDFKKFLDFYTNENRNYIASMLSTHSIDSVDFNKIVSELKGISDFEIYINNFHQVVDNIKNKDNKEEVKPSNGVF